MPAVGNQVGDPSLLPRAGAAAVDPAAGCRVPAPGGWAYRFLAVVVAVFQSIFRGLSR